MSGALKLIVVALAVANFSAASPAVNTSVLVQNVEETLLDQPSQHQARCNDYTYTSGVGAHKVHTKAATWNMARQTCEEEGGYLAIINSVAESRVVGELLRNSGEHFGSESRDSAHIGAHELYGNNDWVTIHGDSLATAGFDIWFSGEPSHDVNNTHCASLMNDTLNKVNCHVKLGFVCELRDARSIDKKAVNRSAQRLLVGHNNYTYTPNIGAYKVHTQAANWDSARKICKEEDGAHLAIINSIAESELIARLVANSGSHNGSDDSDHIWIGYHDFFHEGQFVTVDGKPIQTFGFDQWSDGEPNNGVGDGENCVAIQDDKSLVDIDCSFILGFVCELRDALNIEQGSVNQSAESTSIRRNDYTYTPGIGAHKVHTQAADWDSARKICMGEDGGHLAIINSAAESELIARLIADSGSHNGSEDSDHVYIGYHDFFYEGEFVTVDGVPIETLEFNQWADGEPDNWKGDGENCGSIYKDGKLNDVGCAEIHAFVCELRDVLSIEQGYTPGIGAHKVHTQATDWNSARKICIGEDGGHLAIINSAAESELIARLVADSGSHHGAKNSDYVHIGFHDLFHEGQYVTVDGEPLGTLGFNLWFGGEPDNWSGVEEDCGSIYKDGKLNDVGCEKSLGFVCELRDALSIEQAADNRTIRRNDYTYTPGIGAHKVHTQATDWNSARKICMGEDGGHLAIINSAAESELIARLVADSGSHNDSEDSDYVHIGFHDLFHEGQYVTVDGDPIETLEFNQWADEEPNNGLAVKANCAAIYKGERLTDVDCTYSFAFVCELRDALSIGKVAVDQAAQQISIRRNDYTYTPGIGAHKVHTQAADWNSARKICMEENGGHLAVINSAAESELVVRLVANSGSHNGSENSSHVHIGFHDLFREGRFVTIDGEPIETLEFNQWADGEPNNGSGDEEDCGSITEDGKLNDVNCAAILGFVCELPYL